MSDDEKEDGPAIYRVETIPPPDGEDDAYSAPTKVGPMADAAVRELMQAAERRAAELSARLAEKKAASAAAAKVASSLPTPMSVKPTGVAQTPASSKPPATAPASSPAPSSGSGSGSGAAASSTAPPSPRPAATGPVSGRSPAPPIGPVGRSVPSAAPTSAKPPTMAPRPAAIPRVDAAAVPAPPALPVMTIEPAALAALTAEPLPPAASPSESAPNTPPRLYDEKDETEDAATLLHKSAAPPRQEHTALLPSAVAPHKPTTQPREPIPFDRAIAAPVREPEPPRVLLMPLVVGFLIFAIGLGFYIWAR